MSGCRIFTVDAFSTSAFGGNPAAVVVYEVESQFTPESMQRLAAEMNLSETAYVMRLSDKQGFSLRWWTPTVEVDLCGHATLATSHVLVNELGEETPLVFHTRSGELTVRRGAQGSLEMDFPLGEPRPTQIASDAQLLQRVHDALGAGAFDVADVHFCARTKKLLVHAVSLSVIRQLAPSSADIMAIDFGAKMDVRGIIVTAAGQEEGYDCVSRYFAPRNGIDEDPVTGSAHTVLGVYWSGLLGKKELRAYQASARGGALGLRVEEKRIFISGVAVTVLEGKLK